MLDDFMAPRIGIIGGSGFYSLLENPRMKDVKTEYGKPSDQIAIGKIGGFEVAFLPRHNRRHNIPPHEVNYRANIEALYSLGVRHIIATNAIGSLRKDFRPGEFVVFDQFVDRTQGRKDTFYDKNVVAHVSSAEPYCDVLRGVASAALRDLRIKHHDRGTLVVINGPRFSTRAESIAYAKQGFDVIGMTQYPEAYLARERAMCYVGIGMVTDYDAGLEGKPDIKSVTADEVNLVFAKNVEGMKRLVLRMVPLVPLKRECECKHALDHAIITK